MKFGRVFKQALRNEGFPSEWIDSAISYQQLKKCINRLTNELAQLGLDRETLEKLLKHVEHFNASAGNADDQERPFEYILSDHVDGAATSKTFHPKLLFYVDEATGALHSAKLDRETKRKLQMLAVETGMTDLRVSEEFDCDTPMSAEFTGVTQEGAPPQAYRTRTRPGFRTVEVPLTSDSEFFTKLSSELSGLEALQEKEAKRLYMQVEKLGKQIARLTNPDRRANRKLLAVWRQLFQMYLEEGIYFGTTESDHSAHDAALATERYQDFCVKIRNAGLVDKIKTKENLQAFNAFMHINHEILQGLRFGEINELAMSKILKSESPPLPVIQLYTNHHRIRQTHRSRRQDRGPQTNRLPLLLRTPRQSCLRRSQHADSQPRPPNRRLQLSHVHGN
jgi:E3 ubiquitin-protein ligase BAH